MAPKSNMSQTSERDDGEDAARANEQPAGGAIEGFTRSVLRMGLAIVGFILLIFAIGQAIGYDMLAQMEAFIQTQTGQWLIVAFFALLLIFIALWGWQTRQPA